MAGVAEQSECQSCTTRGVPLRPCPGVRTNVSTPCKPPGHRICTSCINAFDPVCPLVAVKKLCKGPHNDSLDIVCGCNTRICLDCFTEGSVLVNGGYCFRCFRKREVSAGKQDTAWIPWKLNKQRRAVDSLEPLKWTHKICEGQRSLVDGDKSDGPRQVHPACRAAVVVKKESELAGEGGIPNEDTPPAADGGGV